jgi:hypothetical protein
MGQGSRSGNVSMFQRVAWAASIGKVASDLHPGIAAIRRIDSVLVSPAQRRSTKFPWLLKWRREPSESWSGEIPATTTT